MMEKRFKLTVQRCWINSLILILKDILLMRLMSFWIWLFLIIRSMMK